VGFSSVLGFLDSDCVPLFHWEGSLIYTGYVKQIRLVSPARFEYLKFLSRWRLSLTSRFASR